MKSHDRTAQPMAPGWERCIDRLNARNYFLTESDFTYTQRELDARIFSDQRHAMDLLFSGIEGEDISYRRKRHLARLAAHIGISKKPLLCTDVIGLFAMTARKFVEVPPSETYKNLQLLHDGGVQNLPGMVGSHQNYDVAAPWLINLSQQPENPTAVCTPTDLLLDALEATERHPFLALATAEVTRGNTAIRINGNS